MKGRTELKKESKGEGEVSLSIQETNKLRASLGLKPLKENAEEIPHHTTREEEQKKKKTAELRDKLKAAKEKRREEEFFARAKTLGEAGSDSDEDLVSWIEKSRATNNHPAGQNYIEKTDPTPAEPGEICEETEIAAELVGAKVNHGSEDFRDGESMILTLADQPILTEKGELNTSEDALENALKAEDNRRKKAYAASRPKEHEVYDKFGDKKSLLSKYDEEEEEALTIGEFGLDSSKPGSSIKQENLMTVITPISDYGTMDGETSSRKQKRHRQKLRKRTGMLDIVSELEAQKELIDPEASHRKGVDRISQLEQHEKMEIDEREQRHRQFDKALEKANLQALKLKVLDGKDEDEDDELYEALTRAQMAASEKTKTRFSDLAKGLEQKEQPTELQNPIDKSLLFTDTTEFCRLFSAENVDVKNQDSDAEMDTEEHPSISSKPERRRHLRSANKNSERDDDQEMRESVDEAKEKEDASGALREPVLGSGLAAALNTLREKGDLKQKFEWVGRTNDMKKSRLVGVDDFYTCGEVDGHLEKSIETALTRKDQLGRILTPKEAFREICYAFHGKGPSQKTVERRKRKQNEDYLMKKTNLDQQSQLTRLKAVQKVQKNPFVVLTGSSDIDKTVVGKKKKTSKKPKTEKAEMAAPTPILDTNGSNTPLEGNKKVEAMFGIQPKIDL